MVLISKSIMFTGFAPHTEQCSIAPYASEEGAITSECAFALQSC